MWHCWNYYGWGLVVLRSLGVWEEFLPVTWSAVTPTSWEHCHTVTAYLIKLLGDLCPRKLFILLENTAMADVDKNYYKHAEFKVQPDMIF